MFDENYIDIERTMKTYKNFEGLLLHFTMVQSLLRIAETKLERRIYRLRILIGSALRNDTRCTHFCTENIEDTEFEKSYAENEKRTRILRVSVRENIAKLENSFV